MFRRCEQLFLSLGAVTFLGYVQFTAHLYSFVTVVVVKVLTANVITILIGYRIKTRQRKPISDLNNSRGFINGHCLVDQ